MTFGVDKEHENETSIVEGAIFSIDRMDFNALLSDSVTLDKEVKRQFNAKTKETKAWIESKGWKGLKSTNTGP